MKNISTYGSLAILTAFIMVSSYAFCQKTDPAKWDKKTADAWVKGRTWAPKLKPRLDAGVNSQEFAKQYFAYKSGWDKAFEFLERTDLATLAPGKYPIDGDDIFATVSDDPLKDPATTNWEDHQNFIDLHYIISGKEQVASIPFVNVKETVTPYDATKDIGFYKGDGGNSYVAKPNNFFLFFPAEAHKAHIRTEGSTGAKKVVIKIKVIK